MSTLVWPASAVDLVTSVETTRLKELDWLLASLQETLRSIKAGLEECAALLAPSEFGSTLALSSLRSETLKGYITRVGTRVVKGDISIRLPSLPPQKGQPAFRALVSQQPTASAIVLNQLATTRTLINSCLDVVDATQWTGDSKNSNFIIGQLRLLHENIQEAKAALKGSHHQQWTDDCADAKAFTPALPANAVLQFLVSDAAVTLIVRTIEPVGSHTGTNTPSASLNTSLSGFSLRDRLATALGASRQVSHDEADETYTFRGHEVRVRDKIRVDSQDPSLMAAFAKLAALDNSVAIARRALDVVMGKDMED